jgi:hypothetical protein
MPYCRCLEPTSGTWTQALLSFPAMRCRSLLRLLALVYSKVLETLYELLQARRGQKSMDVASKSVGYELKKSWLRWFFSLCKARRYVSQRAVLLQLRYDKVMTAHRLQFLAMVTCNSRSYGSMLFFCSSVLHAEEPASLRSPGAGMASSSGNKSLRPLLPGPRANEPPPHRPPPHPPLAPLLRKRKPVANACERCRRRRTRVWGTLAI